MRTVTLLTVLLVVLAGCSGAGETGNAADGDSGGQTPASRQSPDVESPANGTPETGPEPLLEFVDCVYYPFAFAVETEKVRPALPEGYEPVGFVEAETQVNFNVLRCQSIVVDKVDVLDRVDLATTAIRVSVNESLAGDAELQFYAAAVFVSHPRLASWLGRGLGAAHLATSTWSDGEDLPLTLWVGVGGSTWYEFSSTPSVEEAPSMPKTRRDHHVDPAGESRWLEANYTFTSSAYPGVSLLEAHDGFLSDVSYDDMGRLAGIVGPGAYRGSATPGYYDGETS